MSRSKQVFVRRIGIRAEQAAEYYCGHCMGTVRMRPSDWRQIPQGLALCVRCLLVETWTCWGDCGETFPKSAPGIRGVCLTEAALVFGLKIEVSALAG